MNSQHYKNDRKEREAVIAKIGYGKVIKSVRKNRDHVDGPEIHEISSTGIISIYNVESKKLVTRLIARPEQISRYYGNRVPPKWLMDIAREHKALGYNNL